MFARLFFLLKATGRELVVLWYACRNRGTPLLVKIGAVLLALYVFSPIDLVTDFLPVIGWLDDMTLLAFGVPALLKLVPPQVLAQARTEAQTRLGRWAR